MSGWFPFRPGELPSEQHRLSGTDYDLAGFEVETTEVSPAESFLIAIGQFLVSITCRVETVRDPGQTSVTLHIPKDSVEKLVAVFRGVPKTLRFHHIAEEPFIRVHGTEVLAVLCRDSTLKEEVTEVQVYEEPLLGQEPLSIRNGRTRTRILPDVFVHLGEVRHHSIFPWF